MRHTLVPYRDSIKGITQPTTFSLQHQTFSLVVANNSGSLHRTGLIVTYDIRVSIVHNERLCGNVLRSWPRIEKLDGASRQIFNPVRGEIVSTLFLGRNGEKPPLTRSSTNVYPPAIEERPETGDRCLASQENDTYRAPNHHRLPLRII